MKRELGSREVSEFGSSKEFYRQLKAICIFIANELVIPTDDPRKRGLV